MPTVNMATIKTGHKSNSFVLKAPTKGNPFAKMEDTFILKVFVVPKAVVLETLGERYRLRCGFEVTKPY